MSGYFIDSRRVHNAGQTRLRRSIIAICLSIFVTTLFGAAILLSSKESVAVSLVTALTLIDPESELVPVLIPVQSIETGKELEALMFKIEERPRNQVPAKAFTNLEQVTGLYATTLILANQPLLSEYTTKIKPINQVTSMIPDGFRGVTIRVDERTSVEGWARPGSRVDVTWASTVGQKRAITVIVQNALVISAGRNTNGDYPSDAEAPQELTLLVSKEDARRIILGQQTGGLSLALRGLFESGKGSAGGTLTTDDLLGRSGDGGPVKSVRIIVVGIRDDEGLYDYFNWLNNKLVPTEDRGTFF